MRTFSLSGGNSRSQHSQLGLSNNMILSCLILSEFSWGQKNCHVFSCFQSELMILYWIILTGSSCSISQYQYHRNQYYRANQYHRTICALPLSIMLEFFKMPRKSLQYKSLVSVLGWNSRSPNNCSYRVELEKNIDKNYKNNKDICVECIFRIVVTRICRFTQ